MLRHKLGVEELKRRKRADTLSRAPDFSNGDHSSASAAACADCAAWHFDDGSHRACRRIWREQNERVSVVFAEGLATQPIPASAMDHDARTGRLAGRSTSSAAGASRRAGNGGVERESSSRGPAGRSRGFRGNSFARVREEMFRLLPIAQSVIAPPNWLLA